VSFARHGHCKPRSFPRKRESTSQTLGNALSTDWIPAFAGMTGVLGFRVDAFKERAVPSRRRVHRAALRRFLHHFLGPTDQEAAERKAADLEAVQQEAQIAARCGWW